MYHSCIIYHIYYLPFGYSPGWFDFSVNKFYQKQRNYAMNKGVAQIRDTLFRFFIVEKCPFVSPDGCCFQFLEWSLHIYIKILF